MNQDTYYAIEIKMCSKNGWFTPQESASYYGIPYSREGVTCHWWGDGSGADNHDNITNYFLGQANAGNKSVNYVVSDRKITLMVSPDNVAWCSGAGNATTVSIEHQPTLGEEGYKRSGWLVWQLQGRYGKRLNLYPHSKWQSTSCPGSINLDRIRQEADRWATGYYAPVPTPMPPVVPAPTLTLTYSKLPAPVKYVVNKDTSLWNFNSTTWGGIKAVKPMLKGSEFVLYGIGDNNTLHAKYGMTQYSFGTAETTGSPKATNGVNMVDLDIVLVPPVPPATVPTLPPVVPVPPTPVPPIPPTPPTPTYPNWFIQFWIQLFEAIKGILQK